MSKRTFKEIPLSEIIQTKNHRETYQEGPEMAELMGSIKSVGLQQPISVIKNEKTGKHEMTYGHRRFNAFKKLKLHSIPCLVETAPLTDSQRRQINLMENMHRKNPSPIEYGVTFQQMVSEGYSTSEIAKMLSKPVAFINSCLFSIRDVPKGYRGKIVIQNGPNDRKVGTIPMSAAKMIENAKKSAHIDYKESKQLYKMAEKGQSVQKIKDVISSVRKGAKMSEAQKDNGLNKIEQVTLRMDFFKKDIGPDKDVFAEKLRARIYKELGFKKP